jgi:MYXO-CTERM domain-containing protein
VKHSFVRVFPAAVATLVAHEAAANPPPPKVLPDPPVAAPTKDETPNVVRKHDGVCFAFYPAGGTVPIACPAELVTEPIGEALLKNANGRCQFVPFQAGGPGRVGYLDKCPALFEQVGKSGVIPDESIKLLQEAAAAREKDNVPAMDPPLPARLETTPPQQVGCGGCATSRSSASDGAMLGLGAVALGARLRKRRRRL